MKLKWCVGNRMKIIGFIFILMLLGGKRMHGQEYNKPVSVHFKHVALTDFFKYLEKQSEYHFFYSEDLLRNYPEISVKERTLSVEELLKKVLYPLGLTFSVDKYMVIIRTREGVKKRDNNPEFCGVEKGIVEDNTGKSIPGVNVWLKHKAGVGTTTDENGIFRLALTTGDTVCFSFVGYDRKEVVVPADVPVWNVVLSEAAENLSEVVIVGYGKQRSLNVTGAISRLNPIDISCPVEPIPNILAGRLAGIIGVQRSGEPGKNYADFWIRGISTFSANQHPLVLIDGVERDNLNDLVLEDIEHFSILKDASATAIYGARGGNGVVLIQTHRGRIGKLQVKGDYKWTYETLPTLPEYVDAYDYAVLANEARIVRGESPLYRRDELILFHYQMDADLYPDVNWQKEVLQKSSSSWQANLNVTGGNQQVQYYVSGTAAKNNSAYKMKMSREFYQFRSNLDFLLSPDLSMKLNVYTGYGRKNGMSGGSSEDLWNSLAEVNAALIPVKYTGGYCPGYGTDAKLSPLALLSMSGYQRQNDIDFQSSLSVCQRFDRWIQGVSAELTFAYDNRHSGVNNFHRTVDVYSAIGRDQSDGHLLLEKKETGGTAVFRSSDYNQRNIYLETKLNYLRSWRNGQQLEALLVYSQRSMEETAADMLEAIPYRNQGFAGRLTYACQDIYFSEVNFGYMGTENFPKGERFGFFPSLSVGWVLSGYPGIRMRLPGLTLLKLRYSIGLVGDDKISDKRFPYLNYVNTEAGGYDFGKYMPGMTEQEIGSRRLKWETACKQNLGMDLNICQYFQFTIDYFRDVRQGIFMRRESLPDIVGVTKKPYGNYGEMVNSGFDGQLVSRGKWAELKYECSGTFIFTKNRIRHYEVNRSSYPYQQYEGKEYGALKGLIALGLFENEEEIRMSPKQFGEVLPGDIKYKDVNGDGKLTEEDEVPIGYGNIPKIQYGFNLGLEWKGFYIKNFFKGVGRVNFFYGGAGFYPFAEGKLGNVLQVVADPRNRWIPASYSGSLVTENSQAHFPRLTYGENKNNNRPSTFWMGQGNYFRWKNLEIGYDFSKKLLDKYGICQLRLSFLGDNLRLWNKNGLWDPEQCSLNGSVYPLSRSFTVCVLLGF